MSLTRSIAHNTAVQVVGKIATTLLGLFAVAIMTRSLGAEQFGWYITAVSWLQFVGIISDLGFTVTTSNLLAEPGCDQKKLINTAFTWRLITAFVANGLAIIIILFFPYPAQIKTAAVILSLSFFAFTASQVFSGYFRTALKTHLITISELIGRVILVIGVALFATGKNGFLPMMATVSLASIASIIYLWWRYGSIKLSLDPNISRLMMKRMWPTALAIIFNAFYLQGDRVILPFHVSQAEVGLYGAAYRVLDVVIQIAAIIMGIMMPLVTFAWTRGLISEFKKRYQMSLDILSLILIPTTAGAVVLAAPIMRLVAGQEFIGSGQILRWLAWSILGTCFGVVFGHIALAINRQKEALWIYLSDAMLSVIGYFIFIPRYGLYGAAGVTIFSEFYAGLGLAILTIHYSHFTPRLITLIKIILASVIMGYVIHYFQPLSVIFSVFLGTVIYALLVLTFRIVSLETIREILSIKSTDIAPSEPI